MSSFFLFPSFYCFIIAFIHIAFTALFLFNDCLLLPIFFFLLCIDSLSSCFNVLSFLFNLTFLLVPPDECSHVLMMFVPFIPSFCGRILSSDIIYWLLSTPTVYRHWLQWSSAETGLLQSAVSSLCFLNGAARFFSPWWLQLQVQPQWPGWYFITDLIGLCSDLWNEKRLAEKLFKCLSCVLKMRAALVHLNPPCDEWLSVFAGF